MSHHTPDCRWREPRDPAQILVSFEGEGMSLRLALYPPRADGETAGAYSQLRLDPLGTMTPASGTVWECVVTAVSGDLSEPVRVRPIRFVR